MKVLVIGASGLLAKPVINQLDTSGFQLRLFSRNVNRSMFEKEYEMVQGNVFNPGELNKAMKGCDAVHISLSVKDESLAAKVVVDLAQQNGIKLLSMVSGASVAEKNRWFRMIDEKFLAEQVIMQSGIPYLIFRPTWFFESLGLMVRNGKAMVLGKQPNPSHWVSADDYALMVATAFQKSDAWNKIYYVYGPQQYEMKELLEKYCRALHSDIRKVSVVSLPMLWIIAKLTRNKELSDAVSLFAYFQKVQEPLIQEDNYSILGKPETGFEEWIEMKRRG
jgi:uncharacterized protein YbjT (DUF2867 family)